MLQNLYSGLLLLGFLFNDKIDINMAEVPLLQTIEYFELHILAIFFSSFKQNSPLVTISFFLKN